MIKTVKFKILTILLGVLMLCGVGMALLPQNTETAYAIKIRNVYFDDGVEDDSVTNMPETGTASGSTYAIPDTIPVRSGYTFTGWSSTNGFAIVGGVITLNGSQDVYLVAQWEEISTYTISFNLNGGSSDEPAGISNKSIGDSITLPTYSGTKSGYIFKGWNTNSSATTGTDAGASYTLVEADKPASGTTITFYAIWEESAWVIGTNGVVNTVAGIEYGIDAMQYTVCADTLNYAPSGATIITISYSAVSGLPSGYSIADHIDFKGYITGLSNVVGTYTVKASASYAYDDGDMFQEGSEESPQFTLNVLGTVTYNANEGTGTVTDSNYYAKDALITVLSGSSLTRDGYKFVGWNTQQDGNGTTYNADETFNMGTSNVTLYAVWESLEYKEDITLTITPLVYNLETSNISVSINDSKLEVTNFKLWYDNQEINKITQPGLYTMCVTVEGLNDAYYFANQLNGDVDYYFGDVSISGNTLYFSPSDMLFPYYLGVESCDITSLSNFFGNSSATAYKNDVLGLKLYFNLTGYSITYDDNVDTEEITMPTDTATYLEGASITISSTIPVRNGYSFAGWNTKTSCTGTLYSAGDDYTVATSNVTLYAVWAHTCDEGTFNIALNMDTLQDFLAGTTTVYDLDGGTYYLTEDIELDKALYLQGNISICLNGHSIIFTTDTAYINISSDGENETNVTITDCDDSQTKTYFTINPTTNKWELSDENAETDYYVVGNYIYRKNFSNASGGIEIFNYQDVLVTIQNINFVGLGSYYGGAAIKNFADLKINNCTFKGNISGGDSDNLSGAICNYATLNIYNSVFEYNVSSYKGGAISSIESSNYVYGLFISGCTFTNNKAIDGGAIYLDGSRAVIKDTSIRLNTATTANNGGGIAINYDATSQCLAKGTKILMADGSYKKIENVAIGDMVRTFDHETGTLTNKPVFSVFAENTKAHGLVLKFSNGKSLTICGEHGLLFKDTLKYVAISKDNVNSYLNKYFYFAETDSWVKLISANLTSNLVTCYSIMAKDTIDVIASGLSTVSGKSLFMLNTFDFDSNLKIDEIKKQSDIEKYGIASYSDFESVAEIYGLNIDETIYDNYKIKYTYVTMGKGICTLQELLASFAVSEKCQTQLIPMMAMLTFNPTDSYSKYTVGENVLLLGSNVTIKDNKDCDGNDSNLFFIKEGAVVEFISGATAIDVGVKFAENTGDFVVENSSNSYLSSFSSDNALYRLKATLNDSKYNYSVSGYFVTYSHGTVTDDVPEDTTEYTKNSVVTILDNNYIREGYIFTGWNTKADGTGKKYSAGDNENITEDIELFSTWKKIIKEDISASNDYTITVDNSISNETYQWQKTGEDWVDATKVGLYYCNIGNNGSTPQTNTVPAVANCYFKVNNGITQLRFKFTGTGTVVGCQFNDGYYYPTFDSVNNYFTAQVTDKGDDDVFTDIEAFTTVYVDISGETATQLTAITEKNTYRCVVTVGSDTAISTTVSSVKISFDGNNGTGTAPSTFYQFEGSTVTLPSNPFVRAGYMFIGWATSASATIDNILASGSNYTLDTNDVVFYAIWQDLKYNEDITYTITELKYGVKVADITVTVDDDNLEVTDFKLWYYDNEESQYVAVTTVKEEGLYLMMISVKGKTYPYYFTNTHDVYGMIYTDYYSGNISVSGNTINALSSLSLGVPSCDLTGTTLTHDSTAYNNVVLGSRLIFNNMGGYTVTYDANTTDDVTNLPTDNSKYLKDEPVTLSTAEPTRAGYKFIGWSTTEGATSVEDFADGKFTTKDEDIIFYAVWEIKSYSSTISITIDSDFVFDYGTTAEEIKNALSVTEEGFTIDGVIIYKGQTICNSITDVADYIIMIGVTGSDGEWFVVDAQNKYTGTISINGVTAIKGASGEAVNYLTGEVVNNGQSPYDNVKTLAKYSVSIAGYTVTYDDNVENEVITVPTDSNAYIIGQQVTISTETLVRTGYNFLGWNTDSSETVALTFTDGKYTIEDVDVTLYAIWEEKTDISIVETAQSFTYGDSDIKFSIVCLQVNDFTIEYKVNNMWTETAPTASGTYDVKITRAEDKTYKAYSKEISSGLVINKAQNLILTHAMADWTYSETASIPTATAIYGTPSYTYSSEINGEYVSTKPTDAGTYYVNISVEESDNYKAVSEKFVFVINKLKVAEPQATGIYKYTGEAQTVSISGVKEYMSTADSLSQTKAGVYTITYTLDSNYAWAEGSDGIITWEIRSASITPKQEESQEGTEPTKDTEDKKQEVIVETEEGFTSDITITVEVTVEVEVETKELTVDYYDIAKEEVKLDNNEKVGVVFDVKLIQTVNGVSREIQPSDIKEGTKIKVKMLIPDSVDITKVTRILHVHSEDDIEEIAFDKDKVIDGYYEIEIDRLSEFAFIYKQGLPVWAIILIVIGILIVILIILFIIWKREFDKVTKEGREDSSRKLKFLDWLYRPINKLIFGGKKE